MEEIIALYAGKIKLDVIKSASNILVHDLNHIAEIVEQEENDLDPELITLIRTEAAIRASSGVATMVRA